MDVEFLVSAAAGAGVKDRVGRVSMKIWVALIDPAEIGEQRDKPTVSLVDAVANAVNFCHLGPCINSSEY